MSKYPLTSEFGAIDAVRQGIPHTGIDIGMPIGTTLRSVISGKVWRILDGSTSLGKGVEILGENGKLYTYAHMDSVDVNVGERITYAELLGKSGNTGNSTGPHLHFSVQDENNTYIDPTQYKPMLDRLTGGTYIPDGPANTRDELDACVPPDDIAWHDIDSRITAAINMKACETKLDLLGYLKGVGNTLAELSYTFALIGGGLLIVLRVAGMTRATKYFFVLQVTHIFTRALLGGLR